MKNKKIYTHFYTHIFMVNFPGCLTFRVLGNCTILCPFFFLGGVFALIWVLKRGDWDGFLGLPPTSKTLSEEVKGPFRDRHCRTALKIKHNRKNPLQSINSPIIFFGEFEATSLEIEQRKHEKMHSDHSYPTPLHSWEFLEFVVSFGYVHGCEMITHSCQHGDPKFVAICTKKQT